MRVVGTKVQICASGNAGRYSVQKSYFIGRSVTIISYQVCTMSSLPRGEAAAYARSFPKIWFFSLPV